MCREFYLRVYIYSLTTAKESYQGSQPWLQAEPTEKALRLIGGPGQIRSRIVPLTRLIEDSTEMSMVARLGRLYLGVSYLVLISCRY